MHEAASLRTLEAITARRSRRPSRLSLFALIGAGGIAFDYARLAALDTELQKAADQAALAAATQLDRADGSRDRARDAITVRRQGPPGREPDPLRQ